MTFWQRKELAAHLRAIPLKTVLPLCGAQPDHHDKRKWHTSTGALSVTGAKFMNWHGSVGGGGAIDLVMHCVASASECGSKISVRRVMEVFKAKRLDASEGH